MGSCNSSPFNSIVTVGMFWFSAFVGGRGAYYLFKTSQNNDFSLQNNVSFGNMCQSSLYACTSVLDILTTVFSSFYD